MKTAFFSLVLFSLTTASLAQSIIGDWQLVKENNCMEDNLPVANQNANALVSDMKKMTPPTRQVVSFKEKMSGDESTKILTRKKSTNNKSFMYRFDGESLVILDKKSHTITDSYIVDKFSPDSLIISNASRPCEMRVFQRVK
jgi:hypothetical protein